ncbi:DUF4843 domain-containing protein [Pedobacter sp. ISL-68]|uniref:DUF4843 domain-containing protein n=1 Tax=unclassified Pedobacter TaxID=2628915 RepID=UPI001BEA50A1|nr:MULTISPECIES: DUF4843 domain-containing protein [unclassified Pedobacter]MBT2564119.1 DUF4843 domain-containing protein [Pedobacter sp. ISL-64]MBT2589747.1 DUF4843 domain-containing protein [Pedobacter sp. ISL-68]
MKYLSYILIVACLFSCKKEAVETYQGKDGISFFAYTYELLHTTTVRSYSFALQATQKQKDTLFIPLRITGKLSDQPRTVLLKTAQGTTATAGVDFELKEFTIPAGASKFNYPLILLNSAGMASNVYRIVLEPAETKDFTLGTFGQTPATTLNLGTEENFRYLKVDVTSQYIEPAYWSIYLLADFGEFSAVKYKFMVKTLGITDFSYDKIGSDGLLNFPVTLRNALAAYEAANGPLLDENGQQISFP